MTTTLQIIKCNFKKISSLDYIAAKMSVKSIKNELAWYENIIVEKDFLSGDFYSFRNTYIKQISPITNAVEKIKTEIISNVFFTIDIKSNILEFYGSVKDYSRFVRSITVKVEVINSLEVPSVNLYTFFTKLLQTNPEITLLNLTISEMQLNEFLIGKYQAKVSSDVDAIELIKEFKEKITAFSINLLLDDEDVNISVSENGSYKFSCLDKNLNHIVKILKSTQNISYA